MFERFFLVGRAHGGYIVNVVVLAICLVCSVAVSIGRDRSMPLTVSQRDGGCRQEREERCARKRTERNGPAPAIRMCTHPCVYAYVATNDTSTKTEKNTMQLGFTARKLRNAMICFD